MNKLLVTLAVIVGVLLIVIASFYAVLPAHSLPTFFPGYSATLAKHHYTHAVASLGLGLVCFAYAWFATGKKKN